jgi:hypothetical protein
VTTRRFPAVEFYARREALAALADGVAAFACEEIGGACWRLWLRDRDGRVWAIGADSFDLEFKFEVFTLWLDSLEGLRAKMAARFPAMAATEPPADFQAWPFAAWRVEVLRRAEFLDPGAETGPSFGEAPVMQSACRPGHVPAHATAACDVAVGLLFTGREGGRLLAGADWAPLRLTVSQAEDEIEAFLAPCERVSLAGYVAALTEGG